MASLPRSAEAPCQLRPLLSSPSSKLRTSLQLSSSRDCTGLLFRTSVAENRSRSCCGRTRVTAPESPSPDPGDPHGDDPVPISDIQSNFRKSTDAVQIFFAVLFWMSLFFWASAWDGRDNNKPKKRSWFRRNPWQ